MFRIIKIDRSYIVEVQVSRWTLFGLKKEWKPYVKPFGMNCAWHHKTYEAALINFQDHAISDIESNTEFGI